MSDDRPTGAQVARQALDQARKAAAAVRREAERSVASRRRSEIRAANLNEARARTANTDKSTDPVAFGAAIDDLLTDRGWKDDVKTARVTADWPAMVGAEIADHCEPVSLRDGVLTVEAESTAWATQIQLLTRQVLTSISEVVGPNVVARLVVRGPAGPSWRHGRLRVRGPGPRDTYG